VYIFIALFTVRAHGEGCGELLGVYTFRSSDRPVGPTIVSCKCFVRPVGQTVGCLISCLISDCQSVWTLRPTGRTDWPVGRPITLQRRRYYNQLAGHLAVDCWLTRALLSA